MTTHYNVNGTVDKWDRSKGESITYTVDNRNYSKVIMFVIIPAILIGMYILLTSIA